MSSDRAWVEPAPALGLAPAAAAAATPQQKLDFLKNLCITNIMGCIIDRSVYKWDWVEMGIQCRNK